MRPSTVLPSALARSALIRTSAAAPSLMEEALAAVTVPSFLNPGLRPGVFFGRGFFGARDLLRPGVLGALVLQPHHRVALLLGHRDPADLRLEQPLLLGLAGAAG